MNPMSHLLRGAGLVWTYLFWFLLSDIALVLLLDRHLFPESLESALFYTWFILHFAVNPVLAIVVAPIVVAHASRSKDAGAIVIAVVTTPALVLIAYLGFTRNWQWVALWGVTMHGFNSVG